MHSSYIPSSLAGLLTVVLLAHPAHAHQVPPKQSGPVPADSEIVRIITVAAVRELDRDLAAVALGEPPRAWEITVPDSLAPTWQRARDGLYGLLRARRATAQDDVVHRLSISDVRVQGDSLFASIWIGAGRRCGAKLLGDHIGYQMHSARVSGQWQPLKSGISYLTHSLPCKQLEELRLVDPRAVRLTSR